MQQLGYIKQIDGLRAIAVMMVVVFHWFAGGVITQSGMGTIGVDMFFTLSGFLITRILLVYRWNHDQGIDIKNKFYSVFRFMYRRSLRIFPAYFLILFIAYWFMFFLKNTLHTDLYWYLLYVQNFLFYFRQDWAIGKLSPYWTLAVEEQFYLIWPWLMLFVPVKRILMIIFSFLLIGIVSYHVLPLILERKLMFDILTPTCLHAFAAGSLVAYFHLDNPKYFEGKQNYFLLGGFIFIFISIFSRLNDLNVFIDQRSLVSIGTALILCYLLGGSFGFFGNHIIGNPIFVNIGKVSYGIYLYHNFIPSILMGIRKWLEKKQPHSSVLSIMPDISKGIFLFYLECFLLLFLIAWCSFHFFERPILKLKNFIR